MEAFNRDDGLRVSDNPIELGSPRPNEGEGSGGAHTADVLASVPGIIIQRQVSGVDSAVRYPPQPQPLSLAGARGADLRALPVTFPRVPSIVSITPHWLETCKIASGMAAGKCWPTDPSP
jgi:hypothetical protein